MKYRIEDPRDIAKERIAILLKLAGDVFHSDPKLSSRYVELARKIGMRSGVRIPGEQKRFICKGCGTLLVPGANCRVRIRSERGTVVVVTCLRCGARKHYPAVREKRERRKA